MRLGAGLGPCLPWRSGSVQEKQSVGCGIGWARCYPYINRLPLGGCDTELLLSVLPRVLPGCICQMCISWLVQSLIWSHPAVPLLVPAGSVQMPWLGVVWLVLILSVSTDCLVLGKRRQSLEREVLNCSHKRCLPGFGCELWASETQLSTRR